jgi:hypothetical protein
VADVFITCSRLDRERVRPLAERLISLGFTVKWDKSERGHQDGIDERELEAASAVLAVWSLAARDAAQVHAEAAYALDAGKLIQARLDPAAPPAPFDIIDAADMTAPGAWGPLEQALAQLVRQGQQTTPSPAVLGPLSTLAAAGSPKLVTVAITAALAAYAGALKAAFDGLMSGEQLQILLTGVAGVAAACAALSAYRLFSIARADG